MGGGSQGDTHYCFKEEKKRDKRVGRKAVSRMGKMPQDLGFRGNPWSDRVWEFCLKEIRPTRRWSPTELLRGHISSLAFFLCSDMGVPIHI